MNVETELEVANSIRELLRTKLTKALADQEHARKVFATHLHPSPGAKSAYHEACGRSLGVASCIEGVDDYITALEALVEL